MKEGLKVVIIAGPNGAGKTTFAREFLPNEAGCPQFINVDMIAAGLSPFSPDVAAIRAGRLMLEEMERYVARRLSFAFESTLSGVTYVRKIRHWQGLGYHVKLIFLHLKDPELAVERVAARVAQGGHDVPEAVIRRRYHAGLRNLERLYKPLVNSWIIYDNSERRLKMLGWSEG